jgi:hypothetical protein
MNRAMPTEPEPITVFDVAKRAVDICDPDDSDGVLGDFLAQFEDSDEPVTAVGNLDERIALASEGVDIDVEDPAVQMAGAVMLYLAYRRDEVTDDPDDILRLAARAEYRGTPPEPIAGWLSDRGIAV